MKLLTSEGYLDGMRKLRKEINPKGAPALAMYSSLVDGVVTDPELMSLPIDDHMVVRGHAVFDTCTLHNGWLYRAEAHLNRLFDSAEAAKVAYPYPGGRAENIQKAAQIISETVAVSGVRDATLRYFLSAGPGNFGFGPSGCRTAFYVLVTSQLVGFPDLAEVPDVFVRTVPLNQLPHVKSNNYLLNTLVLMAAKEQGGTFGLTLDGKGNLVESCNLTPILVVKSGLITPLSGKGTHALQSMTQTRVFELAASGSISGVTTAEKRVISEAEVFAADELFLAGGDTHIFPVVQLDGKTVGTGAVGPVTKAVFDALKADLAAVPSPNHIQVSYD